MSREANDLLSFECWMLLTNHQLKKACGFKADDLPDYPWTESYDDGDSPKAAALGCLEHTFPHPCKIDWCERIFPGQYRNDDDE